MFIVMQPKGTDLALMMMIVWNSDNSTEVSSLKIMLNACEKELFRKNIHKIWYLVLAVWVNETNQNFITCELHNYIQAINDENSISDQNDKVTEVRIDIITARQPTWDIKVYSTFDEAL